MTQPDDAMKLLRNDLDCACCGRLSDVGSVLQIAEERISDADLEVGVAIAIAHRDQALMPDQMPREASVSPGPAPGLFSCGCQSGARSGEKQRFSQENAAYKAVFITSATERIPGFKGLAGRKRNLQIEHILIAYGRANLRKYRGVLPGQWC